MKGLTQEEIRRIQKALSESKQTLIFFDSDADGLASYLLIKKYLNDSRGVVVKAQPRIGKSFLRKVRVYEPDLILVLDVAILTEEFVEGSKTRIIHIDHHGPLPVRGVEYYNPLSRGKAPVPTAQMCYEITGNNLWIAMAGIIGDWHLGELAVKFSKEHPDLLPPEIRSEPQALFDSKAGELSRIFNFIMKGTVGDAMKFINALSKIESPYDILEKRTTDGRYVFRRFSKMDQEYQSILKPALKSAKKEKGKVFVFRYPESNMAFTSDLANEIMYRHPDKILIITRKNKDEMKCSIRSSQINVREVLDLILPHIRGYGGGHPHACGCSVDSDDFERFLELFKERIEIISGSDAART